MDIKHNSWILRTGAGPRSGVPDEEEQIGSMLRTLPTYKLDQRVTTKQLMGRLALRSRTTKTAVMAQQRLHQMFDVVQRLGPGVVIRSSSSQFQKSMRLVHQDPKLNILIA